MRVEMWRYSTGSHAFLIILECVLHELGSIQKIFILMMFCTVLSPP